MTRPLIGGAPGASGLGGVAAASVTVDPAVRGQANVQATLAAAVSVVLFEDSFLSTTAAPPGVVYATDTRAYDAGVYMLRGVTVVSASATNTLVWVGFELDGVLQPLPWADAPAGGTLSVTTLTPIVLTGGPTTFAVRLAKVSGTGASEADKSVLEIVRIG